MILLSKARSLMALLLLLDAAQVSYGRSSSSSSRTKSSSETTTATNKKMEGPATENEKAPILSSALIFAGSSSTTTTRDLEQQQRTLQQDTCNPVFDDYVVDRIPVPNLTDFCNCMNEGESLNCEFENVCTENSVCALSLGFSVDLLRDRDDNADNGFVVSNNCISFAESSVYDETCVSLVDNYQNADFDIECANATYGGEECFCSICNDGVSLTVDCTEYNPTAIVSCQPLYGETAFTPFIPEFGVNEINVGCNLDDLQQYRRARGLQQQQEVEEDGDAESFTCHYGEVCNEDFCTFVDMSVDVTDVVSLTDCVEYSTGLDDTCVYLTLDLDLRSVLSCNSATYGGEECTCEVCREGSMSVSIDCSEYDPLAVTDGCQPLEIEEDELLPFVPFTRRSNEDQEMIFEDQQEEGGEEEGVEAEEDAAEEEEVEDEPEEAVAEEEATDEPEEAVAEEEATEEPEEDDAEENAVEEEETQETQPLNTTNNNDNDMIYEDRNDTFIGANATTNDNTLEDEENNDADAALQVNPDVEGCELLEYAAEQYLPHAKDICACETGSILVCGFEDVCYDIDSDVDEDDEVDYEICADAIEVTLNVINNDVEITNCVFYDEDMELEETCVQVTITSNDTIQSCNMATYGGDNCTCTVCEDETSLMVDCSEYDPRAMTTTCQGRGDMLDPFIPAFDIDDDDDDFDDEDDFDDDDMEYETFEDDDEIDAIVDRVNDDINNCTLLEYAENYVFYAEQRCVCMSETALFCEFDEICVDAEDNDDDDDDGEICAAAVEVRMETADNDFNDVTVTKCSYFDDDDYFEDTCIDITLAPNETISSCNNVTYGGQECFCEICDDEVSLIIDCSEYDDLAITDSCQGYDGPLGPFVPFFGIPLYEEEEDDDIIESDNGTLTFLDTVEDQVGDACDLLQYAEERLPESVESCYCDGQTVLKCQVETVCNDDIGLCANEVNITLDVTTGVVMEHCTRFADNRNDAAFEDTCVEVAIGDSIEACNSATYGGQPCACEVCEDSFSLLIDCSEYNPNATNMMCQTVGYNMEPFIPAFGNNPNNGNDNNMDDMQANRDCPLFERIEGNVPDADEACVCEGASNLICEFKDVCSLEDEELCATQVDMVVFQAPQGDGIEQRTELQQCALFSSDQFNETCIDLVLDTQNEVVLSCEIVYYGQEECLCEVCDDYESVFIDCSEFNPLAKTTECLRVVDLVPVVPSFTNPMGAEVEDDESEGQADECVLLEYAEDEMAGAADRCACYGKNKDILNCQFEDFCSEEYEDVCADLADVTVDVSDEIKLQYCTDYVSSEFEETCVEITVDNTIRECNYAYYAGQECECEVCDDEASLFINCTEYNPYAITQGCQRLEGHLSPFVPTFRDHQSHTSGENNSSMALADKNSTGETDTVSCGLIFLLADRVPNSRERCTCQGDKKVVCEVDLACAENTCSDSTEFSITMISDEHVEVTNCATFASDFKKTCVTAEVDLQLNIQQCIRADYGGETCSCSVCYDDAQSLSMDCSMHDPLASTIGCQAWDVPNLHPFVPDFLAGANVRPGENVLAHASDGSRGRTAGSSSMWFHLLIAVVSAVVTIPLLFPF